MYTKIEDQLKKIDKASTNSEKKNVVILGAGMAGLSAAYELQQRDHEVQILEASNRVGGRVWTHRFNSGQYHEFGAMRIPKSHDYTRHYINKFDLMLRPFVTSHNDKDCFYNIKDRVSLIRNAPENIIPKFNLAPINRKTANMKMAPAIFGKVMDGILKELTYEDALSLFGETKKFTERIKELDKKSLDDYLKEKLEDPEIDLIYSSTGLSEIKDTSIGLILRDEIIGTGNGLEEIVGGMDLLPQALANQLKPDTIQFRTEIKEIQNTGSQIQITYVERDQENSINNLPKTTTAEYVICTIPFSKIRADIHISGISQAKQDAINYMSYASSTKVLLHSRKRFWETDYQILGGASVSDKITKQTYYPSDNIIDAPSKSEGDYIGLHTVYSFDKGKIKSQETAEGPGVIVGSYNWGEAARELGAEDSKGRKETVLEVIEKFHPEIRSYVDDHASMFWDEYEWTKGAFSSMKPGDLTQHYHNAISPEGKLFFAGEHCSTEQAWIQGALISSLRVTEQILNIKA